jgi:hypothetical protein
MMLIPLLMLEPCPIKGRAGVILLGAARSIKRPGVWDEFIREELGPIVTDEDPYRDPDPETGDEDKPLMTDDIV